MLSVPDSSAQGRGGPRIAHGPSQVSLGSEALGSLEEAASTPAFSAAAQGPAAQSPQAEPPQPMLRADMRVATLADASDVSIVRINELFKHPDDLATKLPLYRRKFAAERAALYGQLRSAMSSQLDQSQLGLDLLGGATEQGDAARKGLQEIDGLCSDASRAIANYAQIRLISRAHQNVLLARNLLNQFQELDSELQHVAKALERDKAQGPLGPADNLLMVHCKLAKLSEFKCATLKRAAQLSSDMLINLQTFFRRLDALVGDFETYFWQLASKLLDLVRKGHYTTVVHMIKIVEVEERLDELQIEQQQREQARQRAARQQQQLLAQIAQAVSDAEAHSSSGGKRPHGRKATVSSGRGGASAVALAPETVEAGSGFERPIKSYRSTFFDILHEAIANQFLVRLQPLQHDLMGSLAVSAFVIDDLTVVHDELVACVPKKYNLFSFFVAEYHRHVYEMVAQFFGRGAHSDGGPGAPTITLDAAEILALLRWARNYHMDMMARLGVQEDMLEPRLLLDEQELLANRYLMLVRGKIQEWVTNLMTSETKLFLEREEAPELDPAGQYVMSAPVILFQILNQQLDMVASADTGHMLSEVVGECCRTLGEFQQSWLRLVNTECARWATDSAALPRGLPEWVAAVANDQMRASEHAEMLSRKMQASLDAAYAADALARINDTVTGFMLVAKRCVTLLVDFIMADTRPAWIKMHVPPEWYEQDLMRLIVGTFADYLHDYQQILNDYLFQKLVTELLDRALLAYLESFRNKGTKFRMLATGNATSTAALSNSDLLDNPSAVAALIQQGQPLPASVKARYDAARLVELFNKYKAPKRVTTALDPLFKIATLLSATPRLVFLDFYALWRVYPDVPLPYVEALLRARDDMEKSVVKDVMENCRKKISEEGVAGSSPGTGSSPATSSVFSLLSDAVRK